MLMYHSVCPGRPDSSWAVSATAFERQLDLLGEFGWTTVCASDLSASDLLSPKTVALTFDDGFADTFDHAFRPLAARGMRATWFVVSGDVGKWSSWSDPGVPRRRMMEVAHVREVAEAGMEIGAHSRTHRRLTGVSEAELRDEIGGSRVDLAEMTGGSVVTFAYPYGAFDGRVCGGVAAAGFRLGFTSEPGWLGSDPDPYRVRRVAVFGSDSLSAFARKLSFADTKVGAWRTARYVMRRLAARVLGS